MDEAFKDERKWLVALIPSTDRRLKVSAMGSMPVCYVPIPLDSNLSDVLVETLLVGPTPHPELAVSMLCHYFNKVRIQSGIRCSAVPYRDWRSDGGGKAAGGWTPYRGPS